MRLRRGPGDTVSGGDPALGALAANGGPTATMLPQPGSPLIDGAECTAAPAAVATDQRGVTRPQGGACDVGAVEVQTDGPTSPPAAVTGSPRFTG